MPITTMLRKITSTYTARTPISAANFIPVFLNKTATKKLKDVGGQVGTNGWDYRDYARMSPFVMMSDITIAPPLMFPDHPHVGHEFVMYVLDGEFTHEDFLGVKKACGAGDLHWMSAGKGIIHGQVPGDHPINRHIQFWINVPRECKSKSPQNQFISKDQIPIYTHPKHPSTTVKVLAGSLFGESSPVQTQSQIVLADVCVGVGEAIELPVSSDLFAGLYVVEGGEEAALLNGEDAAITLIPNTIVTSEATMSIEKNSSNSNNGRDTGVFSICNTNGSKPLRLILFAGTPIQEAMNVDGYFICGNREATEASMADFEARTGSFVAGRDWESSIFKGRLD